MHAEHAQQVGKLEKRISRRCSKPHASFSQLHTPAAKGLLIDVLVELFSCKSTVNSSHLLRRARSSARNPRYLQKQPPLR
jgi:hypothetical protein